jgi:anti-sigma-K factor RskA
MSVEPHVLESLPAYAVGCLEEAEANIIADHLAHCEMCRIELTAFQAVTEQLALSAPLAVPPTDLKHRLLDRVQNLRPAPPVAQQVTRHQRKHWFPRLSLAWGLVSLLLILALSISNWLLWQRLTPLEVMTGPLGMRAIVLHNAEAAPQASGFVIISADGQNGVLVVDELPPLDPHLQYQLWLMRDGQSINGGVFSVDESGYRGLRVSAPDSLLTYSAAQVTIEPAEGSAYPTGEPVLEGSLHNP